MSNPVFPFRGYFNKEVFHVAGQMQITGTYGGVNSGINFTTAAGLTPQVLSGSSPNQFTSQYPYTRNASGSYTLNLDQVWPNPLAVLFTVGATISGSTNDVGWSVFEDNALPVLNTAVPTGAGAGGGTNQVSFALVKSGSLADPVAGEVLTVNYLFILQKYAGGYFGSGVTGPGA